MNNLPKSIKIQPKTRNNSRKQVSISNQKYLKKHERNSKKVPVKKNQRQIITITISQLSKKISINTVSLKLPKNQKLVNLSLLVRIFLFCFCLLVILIK